MSQTFVFKNYHLEAINKALKYPNASFQSGRSKIRIMKILDEKSKVLEASRIEMLTNLSAKDETTGKALMKNVMVQRDASKPPAPELQYDLSPENLLAFAKEFESMMKEDCIIEIPDSLKNDFSIFKGLIANTQAKDLDDSTIAVIEEALEIMNPADEKNSPNSPTGGIPSPIRPKTPSKA